MKLLALVLFAATMIGASSLSAAVEQCRFINSKPDREACYDRQEKALAARRKPDVVDDTKARSVDDTEMKMENDRLSKSLRSICRGCSGNEFPRQPDDAVVRRKFGPIATVFGPRILRPPCCRFQI